MNTAQYIVREMKVLIIKLQGGTARKLECWMWYFMFTEGRNAKFRTGILDSRLTGDKKNSDITPSSRFLPRSGILFPTNLFLVTPYMYYLISENDSSYAR